MFTYFNPNPWFDGNKKGWKSVDCSVRALCAATGESWVTIYKRLCIIGLKTFTMPHEVIPFGRVALELGYKWVKKCKKDELKVKDLARLSKKNKAIYLCKTLNHFVCCKDGNVLDTFDSSDKVVLQYWVKQ